jgi:outer membrane protein TolC
MADDNVVMVKINVPLWFWKQGSGVAAGQKAKEEAEHELDAMEAMTQWELKSWLSKLKVSGNLLELYKKNSISQSENLMNASMVGYETGTLSYLEFIDNYRSWMEIQMEYFRLLSEYWFNVTMLEKITGKDFIL